MTHDAPKDGEGDSAQSLPGYDGGRAASVGSEPSGAFDPVAFGTAVYQIMMKHDLSFRRAAPLAGVSSATLCRVVGGNAPDVTTYHRLKAWIDSEAAGPHPQVPEGYVLVPTRPSAQQLADMMLYVVANEPGANDFAMVGAVLELLPPTGHPDARNVIADMIRDYRAMISSRPTPSKG